MTNVQINILPKTSLDRWSVGLAGTFILFFALFQILVDSGQRGPIFLGSHPVPFINPLYAVGTAGISALVTGLISIIKSKEQSILVFLAALIGFLVPLFLIGEFLIPH